MGARLWSQRRSARAAPNSSHHAHHTIITPTTFTHSDKVPGTTDLGRVPSVRRYHNPSRQRPSERTTHHQSPPAAAPWPMEYRKDGQPVQPHASTSKKKKKKANDGSKDHCGYFYHHHTEQQQQQQQVHHHHHLHHHHQQQSLHSAQSQVLVMSMAAAQEHATLQKSVQQDTTLGFPHQVPRPDGEERYLGKKFSIKAEHEEQTREFIKPPANKSVNDVGNEAPHRPGLFGAYPPQGECGVGQCGAYPLPQHHSSSSSSSSLSQPGYGEEGRSSPRRQRKAIVPPLVQQYRTPFSPKYQQHESSQRGGWPHGGLGMGIPPPSHVPNNPLPYPSASNTLADIASMPVGCGPTQLSPSDRHTEVPVDSQAMSVGSLGVQQMGGPHRYRQFPESPCSPSAESDDPPYCDVIDNSSLYNPSVSRPSEQRTKSGKI